MKPLPNEEIYNNLCDLIDCFLINSGIRKYCIDCSINKNGCCRGCKYISKNGCITKSLSCKLWLCHSVFLKLNKKNQNYYHYLIKLSFTLFFNNNDLWEHARQNYKDIKKGWIYE